MAPTSGFPGPTTQGFAQEAGPHPADDTAPLTLWTVTGALGEVLVVVAGEIDLGTSPGLETYLRRALDHPSSRTLIVDLRKISFMGARGVDVLAITHVVAMARDIRLAVVADHHPVLYPLHVTAGSHAIAIFPTIRSARTPPATAR